MSSEQQVVSRRKVLAGVAGLPVLSGCSTASGTETDTQTKDPSPVEVKHLNLSNVKVERQESNVGVSCLVTNFDYSDYKEFKIRYTLYDRDGNVLKEGHDTGGVPASEEVWSSIWWEKPEPTSLGIGKADAVIVEGGELV